MKTNNQVYSLRQQGYKVRVIHSRYRQQGENFVLDLMKEIPGPQRTNHGGATQVDITAPNGQTVSAVSKCHLGDPFNRKLGLTIAVGRALKKLAV